MEIKAESFVVHLTREEARMMAFALKDHSDGLKQHMDEAKFLPIVKQALGLSAKFREALGGWD